jgi:Fe-S cluster assembly protein SufB
MSTSTESIEELANKDYQFGFVTDIEADEVPIGLTEDTIRQISVKKNEPEFMLEWRLRAYRQWLAMTEPKWPNVKVSPIDYQSIVYYSAPKPKKQLVSLDEVDPEVLRTFQKLGISLEEQMRLSGVAVDAVFDSSASWESSFARSRRPLSIIRISSSCISGRWFLIRTTTTPR